MISDLTIGDLTIDCADSAHMRDFYADLMDWQRTIAYGNLALVTDNGLTILFAPIDIPYTSPVWPEEPGKQQKQMHLDFTVDDIHKTMAKAVGLGARKAAMQYGGEGFVTMLDPEGRPFCLCQRSKTQSEFDRWYEERGYGIIPSISINIDCRRSEPLRKFYAQLTPWEQDFHSTALVEEHRMVVHFMGCEGDFDYIPPIWPEEPGKQQKQMHFNFQVDDLSTAVEEATRLGARKTTAQYGGDRFVTLLDTEGHPFCFCRR